MQFNGIKPNNRIQLECEHEDPIYRNVRGIVVEVGEKSLILVTDYGDLIEIFEDKVLSVTPITFPKVVSDSLVKIKSYYTDIYDLEFKIKVLKEEEERYKEELFDANFLSKFNVRGAKNRLDKSIEPSLLTFLQEPLSYRIFFDSNPNEQIELHVWVANQFEYHNLDMHDTDKIIRVHAPNIKELLEKSFPFCSKPQELDKQVVHEGEAIYSVRTSYRLNLDITQDNFLEMRDLLINGIKKLSK